MKMVRLDLPEFAFVEGSGHETGMCSTEGRTIILHVCTSSVLEIFDRDSVVLDDGVLCFRFGNRTEGGHMEQLVIALHYSATLDKDVDSEFLLKHVLKPAAEWYCDYCDWEDRQPL